MLPWFSLHPGPPARASRMIKSVSVLALATFFFSGSATAQTSLRPQRQLATRSGPLRCLTPDRAATSNFASAPSDCSANSTTILPVYDPTDILEIPVVVHILHRTNGVGDITDFKVQTQINILNQDFEAITGSNGAAGTNSRIRFKLATTDPQGNATSGITRSANNNWYNDTGNYWSSLSWDPTRYLNIYTNQASGALGYVPYLPQTGPAGSSSDRVVILWTAFGKNAPIGPPYNKGRTTTHEVGHFLGLFHTFDSGCGTQSSCLSTGDLICDTERESSPTFGCPGNKSSCNSSDPIANYMDYSDDLCMDNFTPQQSNRMRCTLMNYRPQIFEVIPDELGAVFCSSVANTSGSVATLKATGSSAVADNNLTFSSTALPSSVFGYLLMSQSTDNVPNFGGSQGVLCLGAPQLRFTSLVQNSGGNGEVSFPVDMSNLPGNNSFLAGQTWYFQYWTRDFVVNPTSNTSVGYAITWQ